MLIRIVSPYFVAGIDFYESGSICAPIISYMRYWGLPRIFEYCNKKGWGYEQFV